MIDLLIAAIVCLLLMCLLDRLSKQYVALQRSHLGLMDRLSQANVALAHCVPAVKFSVRFIAHCEQADHDLPDQIVRQIYNAEVAIQNYKDHKPQQKFEVTL